jgi:hypothetical protein
MNRLLINYSVYENGKYFVKVLYVCSWVCGVGVIVIGFVMCL